MLTCCCCCHGFCSYNRKSGFVNKICLKKPELMENITHFIADNVWEQIECEKLSGYVAFISDFHSQIEREKLRSCYM